LIAVVRSAGIRAPNFAFTIGTEKSAAATATAMIPIRPATKITEIERKTAMTNEHAAEKGGKPETKTVTIIVNGTEYEVTKGKITYEELLALIEAPELPENQRYQVMFSKGNGPKPTGTLMESESVVVKKEMEFDVTPANRS